MYKFFTLFRSSLDFTPTVSRCACSAAISIVNNIGAEHLVEKYIDNCGDIDENYLFPWEQKNL